MCALPSLSGSFECMLFPYSVLLCGPIRIFCVTCSILIFFRGEQFVLVRSIGCIITFDRYLYDFVFVL